MSQPDLSMSLPESTTDPATPAAEAIYASPGVTTNRKVGTGIFLVLLAAFTIFVAAEQGVSVVVSTIIGALFIAGFIAYLRIVAPPPFRITLAPDALRREEQGMERIEITWANVVKVKEDRFPNGLPIALSVYKRVGAKGLHRSFIVYRDDLPGFDDFLADLKRRVPAETRWNIDTVHE
ncbi:MAG: hypothetical protein H0X24_04400 [Ktedonobacterales bacterium]|nr:hypothetical protein [Ktedonobacterales bacterium]